MSHELTQWRFGLIYQVSIWSEGCALQSTNRPSRSQWAMSPINELSQDQVLLPSVKASAEGLRHPWSLNSVELNEIIMVFKLNHWNGLIAILKDCSNYVDYDGAILKICPITNGIPHIENLSHYKRRSTRVHFRASANHHLYKRYSWSQF